MNLFNNLQEQYDQLWKYIIRPQRNTYPQKNLGPQTFELEGKKIKRVDFQVMNPRGYVIFCSHFIPLEQEKYPCVIYMHGNSSNRTEGIEYLGHLIRHNISLCTFDFSGCGNSEGDYVSLGFYQQYDLNEVVQYIRNRPQITSISIWGRSMGAVTGLLYLRKSKHISAAIFDSPFKSLKSLIEDLCKKNSKIPNIIIAGALKIIAGTINEKAKFDVYKLNPLKYDVPFLNYPAFFIVGLQDDLIPPEHTMTLFKTYRGENKHIQKVTGNHNDARPEQCVQKVVNFLLANMKAQTQVKHVSSERIIPISEKKQFNFFDDEDQIENSTKETQNIDFFADEYQHENIQNNLHDINFKSQIQTSQVGESKSNEMFSFASMLSNVLGSIKKQEPIKRGSDGYEKMIERISKQITIQNTNLAKKSRQMRQKLQEQKRNDIKQAKTQTFQKQIISNLQTWAY